MTPSQNASNPRLGGFLRENVTGGGFFEGKETRVVFFRDTNIAFFKKKNAQKRTKENT